MGLPTSSAIRTQSTFAERDAGAGNGRNKDSVSESSSVLERPAFPVFRLPWKHFIAQGTGTGRQRFSVGRSVNPSDGVLGRKVRY